MSPIKTNGNAAIIGLRTNPEQDVKVSHGAQLIRQFYQSSQVFSWVALVKSWISTGVNLALAGPFTASCAATVQYILDKLSEELQEDTDIARNLFAHSCRPLGTNASITIEVFCADFCKGNARWETLGLFFTAVARATIDVKCFGTLYTSDEERRSIQTLAMHYSDRCVDIALSLDCLNDLQLLLQYENWISHAFIDGDQSEWKTIHPHSISYILTRQAIFHGETWAM